MIRFHTPMRAASAALLALLCAACGDPGNDGISAEQQRAAVTPPPQIIFAVTPVQISAGQGAQLAWSVGQATQCAASGNWSGTKTTTGGELVSPAGPGIYDYRLLCSGAGGNAERSVLLQVLPANSTPPPVTPPTTPPPAGPPGSGPGVTLSFSAAPASIALGEPTVLTWSTNNAIACEATGAWAGARATGGSELMMPTAVGTYSYTLSCSGFATAPVTQTVVVTVTAGPTPPDPDSDAALSEFERLRQLETSTTP